MKLGIVANEFFDRDIGPMGGCGWAARQVATFFNSQLHLGVNVLSLTANRKHCGGRPHMCIHDTVLLIYSQVPRYQRMLIKQQSYRKFKRSFATAPSGKHPPGCVCYREPPSLAGSHRAAGRLMWLTGSRQLQKSFTKTTLPHVLTSPSKR